MHELVSALNFQGAARVCSWHLKFKNPSREGWEQFSVGEHDGKCDSSALSVTSKAHTLPDSHF